MRGGLTSRRPLRQHRLAGHHCWESIAIRGDESSFGEYACLLAPAVVYPAPRTTSFEHAGRTAFMVEAIVIKLRFLCTKTVYQGFTPRQHLHV